MQLTLLLHGLIFLFLIPLKKIQIIFKTKEGNRSCQLKRAIFNEGTWFKSKSDKRFFPGFSSTFRLLQYADIYTSNITNLNNYSLKHKFYPRRGVLPHEFKSWFVWGGRRSIVQEKKCLLDTTVIFVKSILLVDHSWRYLYALFCTHDFASKNLAHQIHSVSVRSLFSNRVNLAREWK